MILPAQMPSFSHEHYVPFLKAKTGELTALAKLGVDQRERVTPWFEVGPLEAASKGKGAQTVEKALHGLGKKLVAAWSKIEPCFLDLPNFPGSLRMADGSHPVTAAFADTKAAGLVARPVSGLDRDEPHQDAIRSIAEEDRLGVGLRVRRWQLAGNGAWGEEVVALCANLGVEPVEVDLQLDFGEVTASIAGDIRSEAEAALRSLPTPDSWRSLTLASGAFPAQPSGHIKAGESGHLPRRDWQIWRSLQQADPPLPRLPAFGDYGITHPSWLDYDPKTMTRTAGIRYATAEDWFMLRGKSLEVPGGHAQFHGLSASLVSSKEFEGVGHCWGDKEIKAISIRKENPGSLTTWRAIGTAHHLEVVERQIASLA